MFPATQKNVCLQYFKAPVLRKECPIINTRQYILCCPPKINRHGLTPKFCKLRPQRSNSLLNRSCSCSGLSLWVGKPSSIVDNFYSTNRVFCIPVNRLQLKVSYVLIQLLKVPRTLLELLRSRDSISNRNKIQTPWAVLLCHGQTEEKLQKVSISRRK